MLLLKLKRSWNIFQQINISSKAMSSINKVAPADHPMYDWTDPKRVGPGAWYMFMLMSCHAKDKIERLWVCTQIRLFCDYFKCGDCNGHCHKYIEEHPPEETIDSDKGLFDWVVVFMNAVNERLGKLIYDRDILLKTFTQQEFKFCGSGCGQKDTKSHSKEATFNTAARQPTIHYSGVGRRGRSARVVYPRGAGGSTARFSSSASQFF
jgi:hypothetical protein